MYAIARKNVSHIVIEISRYRRDIREIANHFITMIVSDSLLIQFEREIDTSSREGENCDLR